MARKHQTSEIENSVASRSVQEPEILRVPLGFQGVECRRDTLLLKLSDRLHDRGLGNYLMTKYPMTKNETDLANFRGKTTAIRSYEFGFLGHWVFRRSSFHRSQLRACPVAGAREKILANPVAESTVTGIGESELLSR